MSSITIEVNDVSKSYRIGHRQSQDRSWRRYLGGNLDRVRGFARRSSASADMIWALHNVSFEVREGEALGIVGRNGAGKSTLLKILSRITKPTAGTVALHGRVGSLLEVGTGFHPELTGRENIYMNGAILGMRKAEIDRNFDEIVAFAEVDEFIDTPVKRYSSGMRVRLAFAVAAHLEPEILLIDEVLAVGDARFQKKCLNMMEDVGHRGRTVLFVSHNMPAITRLCPRSLLIDSVLLKDGPSHEIVNAYLSSGQGSAAAREWTDPAQAPGGNVARLRAVRVRTQDGKLVDSVDIRQPVGLEMEYDVLQSGYLLLPHYHVFNEEGLLAFEAVDLDPTWRRRPRQAGRFKSTAWVPGNLLGEGMMYVEAVMITLEPTIPQFLEPNAVTFQVLDPAEGDSARGDWVGHLDAAMRPMLEWKTDFEPYDGATLAAVRRQAGLAS